MRRRRRHRFPGRRYGISRIRLPREVRFEDLVRIVEAVLGSMEAQDLVVRVSDDTYAIKH